MIGLKEPTSARARVVRSLRVFRNLRGWQRLMNVVVPSDPAQEFVARNGNIVFTGSLASFIDRQLYLYGGYEEQQIARFLELVPASRRGVILDVGANVGTHALRFAQVFRTVHAFEPNPQVHEHLARNVAANSATNVTLHQLGLADTNATLDFFVTTTSNHGMGTFVSAPQYTADLVAAGRATVARGDDYLARVGVTKVDAIKVDIQGFEPEALAGLRAVLTRDRPIVWFEAGAATLGRITTQAELRGLLPYEFSLKRFMRQTRLLWNRMVVLPVSAEEPLVEADYIALPR
jgi:FkbM family methyltransferase